MHRRSLRDPFSAKRASFVKKGITIFLAAVLCAGAHCARFPHMSVDRSCFPWRTDFSARGIVSVWMT